MDKDTVYRQDAIDSVQGIGRLATLPDNDAVIRMSAVEYVLYNLPSAQPEIIHCRDCKHHWTHSCMDAFPREICDLDQTFYDSNIDYCSLAERRTR